MICPRGPFAEAPFELIDGIEIHRHPLPIEASGKLALPCRIQQRAVLGVRLLAQGVLGAWL